MSKQKQNLQFNATIEVGKIYLYIYQHFYDFGMTPHGIEIRFPGSVANTLHTRMILISIENLFKAVSL